MAFNPLLSLLKADAIFLGQLSKSSFCATSRAFSVFYFTRFKRSAYVSAPFGIEPHDEKELKTIDDNVHSNNLSWQKIQEHEVIRELYRKAAYELPGLTPYTQPFKKPADSQIFRFESDVQMSSFEKMNPKVVVTFKVTNIPLLEEKQRHVLRLLVGPRYNPEEDLVRISSDKYSSALQNKYHLIKILTSLIEESKRNAEKFSHVPLDTRHWKYKKCDKRMPQEWLADATTLTSKKKTTIGKQSHNTVLERESIATTDE
ncbi:37S ribosomal protein S24, mitochondrial [Schizosaccharomyces pombe]